MASAVALTGTPPPNVSQHAFCVFPEDRYIYDGTGEGVPDKGGYPNKSLVALFTLPRSVHCGDSV